MGLLTSDEQGSLSSLNHSIYSKHRHPPLLSRSPGRTRRASPRTRHRVSDVKRDDLVEDPDEPRYQTQAYNPTVQRAQKRTRADDVECGNARQEVRPSDDELICHPTVRLS